MALVSSGTISLADVQGLFGGSDPIGINEYYNADVGVPASGTISLNNFYGRNKGLTASYTARVSYSIPAGAGGVGEGFYRTAADWYNSTDRQGSVRLWGSVTVGGSGRGGFYAYSKITGYRVIVDGTWVSNQVETFGGPQTMSWDVAAYVNRGSYVYLSAYSWGDFGSDRVGYGTFNVGYD